MARTNKRIALETTNGTVWKMVGDCISYSDIRSGLINALQWVNKHAEEEQTK